MCPDYDVAAGGIRVIYRFVDILNSEGIEAAVVHRSEKFRPTWFESQTAIIGARDVRFQQGDILIVPEWYRQLTPWLAPGVPNLILNQNAYETFTDVPFERGKTASFNSSDTIGIVVISEDSLRYLGLCFPEERVDAIRLSIDAELFHVAPEGKTKTIAYMPRKRLKELNQILHLLERRGSLDGWELLPIIDVSEVEVARRLGRAAVFLALNEREGIALPPLEAMASGCVVVGFHGGSGEEYMKPDVAVPIADGEVASFVVAVESVLERWVGGDTAQVEMTKRALAMVKDRYSPERERADVVKVFGEALERVSDVVPGTAFLDWKLLPSTSVELKKTVTSLLEGKRTRRRRP
ncbi:MAG TPA: glycosyltransferase [Acidimicrobiales bacterium]|nr:glycosyltransferase [Acidimicrobiales bacterium]